MTEEAFWGLLPVALFAVGIALLWYSSWKQHCADVRHSFLRLPIWASVLGCVSLIAGGLALAISTLVFAPLLCIVAAVVVLSGNFRYTRSEVRYLVWSLAVAAQRSIPLEKAARAFAAERRGRSAPKARRLAEYLDAAMPLSIAMTRARLHVASHIRLAADVGEKTGTLGPSLQQAVRQSSMFDGTFSSLVSRFLYVSCLVLAMLMLVTFMMLKIVPTFAEMYSEFGFDLPLLTQLIMGISESFVTYWYVAAPFLLLVAFVVLVALLLFVGVAPQSLPIVPRFSTSMENSAILSSLAIAVERRQSILDNLSIVLGLAPSMRARRRLAAAMKRVEAGTHWSDALRESGLNSKSQNGIIQSAERAGNLVWALNEIADSMLRRAVDRLRALLDVLFPVCVVGVGACVLFIAAAMLLPLFSLIGKLT